MEPQKPEWQKEGEDLGWKAADAVVKSGLRRWWGAADDGIKLAVGILGFALAIGPLGQGALAALKVLYSPQIPSAKQLEAVAWLAFITAPVFAGAAVLLFGLGRFATAPVLMFAGAVAFASGAAMPSVDPYEPLGKVYCYADVDSGRIVYEQGCREFDRLGFIVSSGGPPRSPGAGARVLGWAFVYIVDARGFVMAASGVLAGGAIGYLGRRQAT